MSLTAPISTALLQPSEGKKAGEKPTATLARAHLAYRGQYPMKHLAKITAGFAALFTLCTVSAPAVTIFSDSFASSTLGTAWTTTGGSGNTPRVATSTTYRSGTTGYGVTLDDSTAGTYSTTVLNLKQNLATFNNVVLTFKCRNVGNESHATDGLYISPNNGTTYYKISTYTYPAISSTFSAQTVNLSTAATSLGIVLGPNTIVRWQVYDDYSLPSDGVAIDDVAITGDAAPATGIAGVGALLYAQGTAFRVWAPNASAVNIAGTFNSWNGTSNPMASEGNGWWSVKYNGAVIGDQYKYVITNAGVQYWRQDPQARQVVNDAGNSIIMDPSYTWGTYTYNTPSFNQQVIYEMHIGTFNDTVGGNPGTWATAQSKLSHLSDLGVNMLEVMPAMEFPGDTSWGYNPHCQFAPESIYGTPQSVKSFVNAAHQLGIGVMMDVVINHMGSSPNESSIPCWIFDGTSYGNGGIYFFSDWRKQTPWGWARPDYGRGEVRDYLKDSVLMWLNDYRMDGIRYDSTVNIRTQNNGGGGDIAEGWTLGQYINNSVDVSNGYKIQIAEDLQNNEWITKTTGAGGMGFDSQWDAGFVHPIRTAVITGNDTDRDMNAVAGAINHYYNGSANQRVIYTESHDEVNNGHSRVPEEIWPGNASSWYSRKRSMLGAGVMFTSPGIPMMFMGQEFLEDGYWSDTDPLDWNKNTTYGGTVKAFYRDMIHLRRNWNNNTRGLYGNNVNVFHVNNTNKVVAYHRYDAGGAGDDVVCVANFANTSYGSYNIGAPRGGTWYVRLNSDWNGYGADFANTNSYNTTANAGAKDGLGYNMNVGIGPYTIIVLSQ